jgi:peptide/nickel transport system substrate-binding protein
LGQFITAEEAQTRYANLQEWYRKHGHFWLGTGPYYLDKVFPVEGTVIMRHNPKFPDAANKWDRFDKPMIAEVELDGPGRVSAGSEAIYDIFANFEGNPYPDGDVEQVKYLVFNAAGELAFSGEAEAVEEGHFQVRLSPEQVSQLEAGSNRLEVGFVSRRVSIPTFATFEFVSAP